MPVSINEDARRQRLLDIIAGIMGSFSLILLIWAIVSWQIKPSGSYQNFQSLAIACSIMVVGALVIFILNRFWRGYFARTLFVTLLLFLTLFDSPAQIADGRVLLLFSIPIIAAAILIRPSASFILALISSVIVEIAARSITPALQPFPSIVVLFLLATFIWMSTSSLERHIEKLREANTTLMESEERYRSLMEISPDMVILSDLEGKILVVNPASLALFGYADLDEVRGKRVWEFIAPEDQPRAIADFGKALESGVTEKVEYCALNKQGSPLSVELSAAILKDQTGSPQAILSVGRDVTLRKKMEQALLAEKDEAYRALVNNSAQGLVLLQNGRIILANTAIADCLGLTLEELYALPEGKIFDYVHPEDRGIGMQNMRDRLQGKSVPARYESRVVNKNGTIRWLELMPTIITLNGIPTSQITTLDITERKNAEEAMRAARDQLEATLNTLPDILFELDREKKFCSFRVRKSESFFPVHETFLGKNVDEVIPPEAARIMSAALDDALQNGQHRGATYDIDMPTGKYSFELSISTMGDMTLPSGRFIMLVRDITDRKRAEDSLRESEKRYRDLFENASLAVFQSAVDGKIIAVNPEFARMFGYQSPEEVKAIAKDATDVFANPQRRAEIIRLRAENPALNVFENVYRRKDGSTFIGQLTIKAIMDGAGQLQLYEGFIEDITPRKLTESALRESEQRYRGLAEAAQDIIVIVSPDDRIEYVNKFAAQLVGMSPEEVIGLPRSHFFPPAVNDRQKANLQKVVEHGQPMFTESRTPFPKGEIWLSNWMVPLKDESGAVKEILAISRNITGRKALEEALFEAKNSLEQRVAERTADLINSHEQLRRVTRQTVMAQENERRRLSRELHDEAGQALIGLKFSLDEILTETPEELESTRSKISKTLARANDLNQRIRNLAHGLRPPILDVAGIDLALKGLCREFSEETRFPVTYSGTEELSNLSEEISITLYRFVQESITNVVKHAHASEARVSLRRESDCITLSVKDNGAGFDVATTPKGVGLLGMEERLGLLGGRLEITSRRKRGTHLKAVIPFATEVIS